MGKRKKKYEMNEELIIFHRHNDIKYLKFVAKSNTHPSGMKILRKEKRKKNEFVMYTEYGQT